MACSSDWEVVGMLCGYEPCQHEGKEGKNKNDFNHKTDKVMQCPICKVWNYSHVNYMKNLFKDIKPIVVTEEMKRNNPMLWGRRSNNADNPPTQDS